MNLQQLVLERELHQVLVRYARLCDERDWSLVDQIFSEDATAQYGPGRPINRDEILAMLQNHLGGCGPTQHMLGNLVVLADSESVCSQVSVRAAHCGSGQWAGLSYECLGQYHDRWCLTSEGWRIKHRTMRVTLEYGNRKVLCPPQGPDTANQAS